ncbi:MAG TPA: hypothetical protein VGM14_28955 [Streptosporangiaceae bacterium]
MPAIAGTPLRAARAAVAAALVAAGLLIAAPAALANWAQQPTAPLSGVSSWSFAGVSCTSPNICMAVGVESPSTSEPLSETRSPSGWTQQPISEPADGSQLIGVFCTKASACTAVGATPTSSGSVPLAERWNGSSWSIQKPPAPGGASFSVLDAVACTSSTRCLAVGDVEHGIKESPLTERWNGGKWKVLSTPKPAGQPLSGLTGISCASATKCFAVGSSSKNNVQKTLAEVWNGAKWTIQKTPNAAKGGGLEAVSCRPGTPGKSCMAVGDGLAERWNGKAWSLLKIGKPSGSAAELVSVSCTKAGPCYAVGSDFIEGVQNSVAELWNGSRWSVQPISITTSSDTSQLQSVSCTTATNCTAVGSYHDPVSGTRPLAEDFSIAWHDASPAPLNGVVATGLNAVSCASPNSCVAVGTFETQHFFESFSQVWDGTQWSLQPTLKPKTTNLSGVSCPAADACMAVGNLSTGVSQVPLAERWDGKKWRITPTPNPAEQKLIELTSVSCPSASMCLATGTFAEGTFAQVWNGKTWKATSAVPNPIGASHSTINAVSCPSAKDCIVVGTTVRKRKSVPLAERWNGAKFSSLPISPPANATESGLTSVSCSSATACGAIGFDLTSVTSAAAYSWTGRRWIGRNLDLPVGSLSSQLRSVSCNSAVACMATGSFNDSSNVEQQLAEQYS